jgi:hypothetical protein
MQVFRWVGTLLNGLGCTTQLHRWLSAWDGETDYIQNVLLKYVDLAFRIATSTVKATGNAVKYINNSPAHEFLV